jgi:hypothetical protein
MYSGNETHCGGHHSADLVLQLDSSDAESTDHQISQVPERKEVEKVKKDPKK